MPAAAADAPVGSHHGCQIKKYVLTKVINQITARRARPIYYDLQRVDFSSHHSRETDRKLRMAGKSTTGKCDQRRTCRTSEPSPASCRFHAARYNHSRMPTKTRGRGHD